MVDHRPTREPSSVFLLDVLSGRDADDDPAHAQEEKEAARLVRKIAGNVVNSRQKLADLPIEKLDALVTLRSVGGWLLDDFYCQELLERIPKMVKRTLELSSLTIPGSKAPTGTVHVFYEQAVRCYIMGLWQAASVLARGTVETALRECLEANPRDMLKDLIGMASRTRRLSGSALEAANYVKVHGDPVVHGAPATESDAKHLVVCAREVMLALFGGRMGDESRP